MLWGFFSCFYHCIIKHVSLFVTYKIPALSFIPTHVLSLLTTGSPHGLVIEVGNLEAVVLPIATHHAPMMYCLRSTPRAGRHLSRELRRLLAKYATLTPSSLSTASSVRTNLTEDLLSHEVVEDIKTRLLFVSPIRSTSVADSGESQVDWYQQASMATDTKYRFKDPVTGEMRYLIVPGWIRERAAECIFGNVSSRSDGCEEEEEGIILCTLECLLKVHVHRTLDKYTDFPNMYMISSDTCGYAKPHGQQNSAYWWDSDVT